MINEWIEVALEVPAAAADAAGAEMMEAGCEGVTIENRQLDTFVPPDPDEVVAGVLELRGYFPAPNDVETLLGDLQERMLWLSRAFPGWEPQRPVARPVAQEDWADGWKQHFSTTRIGRRLVVRPSWEAFSALPEDVVVEIDPGMAFGTGTHGTTRLCLEALAEAYEDGPAPRRVLDVGTGSGILAIAAAAYGAETVVACEIDPDACAIAFENAAANGQDERIAFTVSPLEELESGFDLILANILAEENIRLADQLVSRLAPRGILVLSGILIEKEAMVVEAFTRFDLGPPSLRHNEDWSCIVYQAP